VVAAILTVEVATGSEKRETVVVLRISRLPEVISTARTAAMRCCDSGLTEASSKAFIDPLENAVILFSVHGSRPPRYARVPLHCLLRLDHVVSHEITPGPAM
jgi:hypothetical protein